MLGWIASIIVLASQRFRENSRVRFHAFQGLYLFVAWLIVRWFISPASGFGFFGPSRFIPAVLGLLVFAAWIIMLIKVHQNEDYRLPIIGELADRSVSEQNPF